jgi:Protein of unknown function (DUF3108)
MTFNGFRRPRMIFLAALVALAGLSATFLQRALAAQAPQSLAGQTARTKPALPPAANESPMPFRPGERLNYQVSWTAFATAASVELSIPEVRDLYGWRTWHFRASAHTMSPVRALFAIDDEFDSYTDATTLESRQFESYLNEMGRKEDQQWRFVAEGQVSRAPEPTVIVLPGTRDPLGALYALRAVDWQHAPVLRAPVYDGHQFYEMRAKMEGSSEVVEVPAGTFSTARIAVEVFQHNKEVPGIDFAMWLARDSARTPVLMRAELSFGTLRVELTSPER